MPLTDKGKEILRSMTRSYKDKDKAKRVLFASLNAGKIKGVEK